MQRFHEWIISHKKEDSVLGDLAKDMVTDIATNDRAKKLAAVEQVPSTEDHYESWWFHLIVSCACKEALQSLHDAWDGYERYVKDNTEGKSSDIQTSITSDG